ncbi:TIM protein, partial [Locustella ochotensis]|nr:TIM protein [Locustella ochotensis]
MEEHYEEGAGQDLAQHLHEEGLAGPLRWLENCLRRVAGDREEDEVPSPCCQHSPAMFPPPLSAQESFWRIPAALTPRQLRRAAASIAHRGPSGTPQDLPEPPGCPQDPAPEPPPAGLGSDSESEEPVPVPSPAQPRTKRRRELTSEDEDED